MKNKYKTIKVTTIELLLIILLESCTVFLIFSTVSQFNFKNNIRESYNKNYPLNDGLYITFPEIVDSNKLYIKENLDLKLERNLYKFITNDNEVIDKIYFNVMNYYPQNALNIKKPNEKDLKEKIDSDIIYGFSINKSYYEDYIKNNITGDGFKSEYFLNKENVVPIIMGNSFKKSYKLGEIIESSALGKSFKVVGFLDKNMYIFSSNGSPANGIESLNSSIISPYNEEILKSAIEMNLSMQKAEDRSNKDSIYIYDLTRIIPTTIIKINSNYALSDAVDKLNSQLTDIGINAELISIKSDIDNLLNSISNEVYFNMAIILILGMLSIMILVTTINYKIIKFKYNIGLLFSLGATTKDIFKILSYKLLQSSCLSLFIGGITYILIKKTIYKFFINNLSIRDIIIGSLIYIIIIIFSSIISIYKIKNITPISLLREGRE